MTMVGFDNPHHDFTHGLAGVDEPVRFEEGISEPAKGVLYSPQRGGKGENY